MENKAYMEQGLDLKRLVLVLGKKIWLVLVGIVIGGILGGITYKVITGLTNGQPEYRATADYYISFNFDEFEHGDDYYNAYTWDGILRDDPIVDYALSVLPETVTKEMVIAAVTGEMLGDYRILTVHVTADTKEMADMIAQAYQKSMVHFGQQIELLEKIEVWSSKEATLLEKNTKTLNAAFLGSLLAGIGVTFVLLFYYVLEQAVYIEQDAKALFGYPVLGMETRKNNEVQKELLENNLVYCFGNGETVRWNAEQFPKKEEYEILRKASNLVIEIPWGKDNGRQIGRVLEQLKLQGCQVKGIVITGAEDTFLRMYYGKEYRENK